MPSSRSLFVFLIVISVFVAAPSMLASCTVSINATLGNDGVYSGTITTADSGLVPGGTESLYLYLDGQTQSSWTVYSAAETSFPFSFVTACWAPAPHTVKAWRACSVNNQPVSPVTDEKTVDTTADIPSVGSVQWQPAQSASDPVNNPPTNAGYITYDYAFPHTSYADRAANLYLDGVWVASWQDDFTSGHASHYYEICGSHHATVWVSTCSRADKSSHTDGELTIANAPILTNLQLNAAQTQLTGSYSFPFTNDYSGREIRVYVNGLRRAYDSGLSNGWPIHGGISFTNFPSGCIDSVRVEATSNCSPLTGGDAMSSASEADLHLAVKRTDAGQMIATVKWDLHHYVPGYTIDLRVMRWYDENGAVQGGYSLTSLPVNTVSGTADVPFAVPAGWREVFIEGTLASCGGGVRREAHANNDCCPIGAGGQSGQSSNPVLFVDGNVRYTDTDPLPAIGDASGIHRTYDSQKSMAGLFGVGWSSMFDRRIMRDTAPSVNGSAAQTYVYLTGANDAMVIFNESGSSYAPRALNGEAPGTLVLYGAGSDPGGESGSVYEYRPANGRTVARFRVSDMRFAGTRDLISGRMLTITYANGLPVTVIDSWTGVTWNVTTSGARIIGIGVAGRPDLQWTYIYDGSNRLTSVLVGSSTWRTYNYSGGYLADIDDAAGNLIETHSYDTNGRAISSTGSSDEIQNITYSDSTTTVTMRTGATASYDFGIAGTGWRPGKVTGTCASCGARDAVYAYDLDGNLARQQYADGYIDEMTYAGGRITSRTSHLRAADCDPATSICLFPSAVDLQSASLVGTSATTNVSYVYGNGLWPDRVTSTFADSVRNPTDSRVEIVTLDDATGEVLTRTSSGWTGLTTAVQEQHTTTMALYNGTEGAAFAPGGAFDASWVALAQPAKQRKSIDGPRTDVSDVTSFVYYPVNTNVPALWRGKLAATKNAAGHIARYENYDAFGNATRVVDPNGVTTESTFDVLGRLLTSTLKGVSGCDTAADPLCAMDLTNSRTYTPSLGPLGSQTDAIGNVNTFEYDSRGRMIAISRGPSAADLRERREYTYDVATGLRNLERYLARESGSWVEKRRESFTYDTLAQLSAQTHADNTHVTYTYDAMGSVTTLEDEKHTIPNTHYVYDAARRLSVVRQALIGAPNGEIATSYAYDTAGNLTNVTDPNGNQTTYVYDDFGRMLFQSSPVTGGTSYSYDAAGDLLSTTDANNAVTTRTYDLLGRLTTSVAALGNTNETTNWTYDRPAPFGLGRLGTMIDAAGTSTYAYDRRGLLLSDSRSSGSVLLASTFQYDANGNRTLMRYPSGLPLVYTYDFAGRQSTLSVTGITYLWGATYLPFGPETSLTFANGTTQTRTYDARYQIQRNTLSGPAGTIADYTYSEDGAGNITAIHDALDSTYDRNFAYDDLNRLITANTGTSLWGTGSFRYDTMGNMLARDLGNTVEYNDDPLSRRGRLSASPDSLPAPGSIHETYSYQGTTSKLLNVTSGGIDHLLTYDAAGNEVRYFDTRTYSPRNLMTSITEPSEDNLTHTVTYAYDGRGVRLVRSEGTTSSGTPFANRYYVYSPELQLMAITVDDNPNIWAKTAISNVVPAMKYEIVWFNGRPAAHLADGTTGRYTFTDHLGTPLLQTDTAATVTWRAEYEPYGDLWTLRTGTTAAEQPLRFPGQEYERRWEGTEERYNIFRWYRAGWGRYTQGDPAGVQASPSLYSYAGNDPIGASDPSGLMTFTWIWGPSPAKPSLNPSQQCNGVATKAACTNFKGVTVHCSCTGCDGVWYPEITMFVNVTMYVYNGPYYKGIAEDQSIVDQSTARAHEVKKHLGPAAQRVNDWLRSWVVDTSTRPDCEGECQTIIAKGPGVFEGALQNTRSNN